MKSIAAKLVQVMSDCDYIQKQGKNDFHKYRYAMAADVLEKVNASLVKHRVVSFAVPELIEFKDVTNAKGNTEHLATVKMHLTLVDADSGENIEVIGLGSGQDAGDKAIMKAQTAALKYAWMLTLNISTGDDPEADTGTDERMAKGNTPKPQQKVNGGAPNGITEAERKHLGILAKEAKLSSEQMKELLSAQYGVENSAKLTKVQYSKLIDYLTAMKEGGNK